MNKNQLKNIIILVLLIILFFSIKTCNSNKNEAINFKGKYDLAVQSIDSFKNKEGLQIVEQKPAVFTNDTELKKKSKEIFDLKRKNEKLIKEVNALVITNQQVVVRDSSIIPYDNSNDYVSNIIDTSNLINKDSVIIPPKKFNNIDSNYSISGTVLLKGIKIDSISLQNKISWRLAEKKTGWFKKKETIIQVINSNKYFITTSMNSMVVKHKTNTWNKIVKPAIAFIAGAYITSKIIK